MNSAGRVVVGCILILLAVPGCRTVPVAEQVTSGIPQAESLCEKLGVQQEWAEVPSAWWRVFQDPSLNALVESVLGGNSSLSASWRRLEQSGYATAAVRSQRYPQMTLSGFGGVSRRFQMPGGALDEVELWGTSAGASYELDVWRRVASAVGQAELIAQASFYDYEAMAVSLAAAVCEAWFDVNERMLAVDLLRAQLASSEEKLGGVEERYRLKQGAMLDVVQQQELVANVRSQIPAAEVAVVLARNRLAVLAGVVPGERESEGYGEGRLPEAPPSVTLDIDSDVAEDRPDVMAALALLGAAERGAALALRDRFPVLRLNASVASQSEGVDGLFDEITSEALLGLTLPLSDGGRRRAETGQARSLAAERLEMYSETVLQAMREIHDARILESSQAETVRRLEEELEAARRTLALSDERYRGGLTDYLGVLVAQTRVYQLERAVLGARRLRLSYRVQFCRALAGSDVGTRKRTLE
jgi:multidrug efflux system outer membrane protein